MIYTVEVSLKPGFKDHHGEHIRHDIAALGLKKLPKVEFHQLYNLDGDITHDQLCDICEKLLIDPITEKYSVAAGHEKKEKKSPSSIEVWLKSGVTDTVSESVGKAIKDLKINEALSIKTGQKYIFRGKITAAVMKQIAERFLINPMIQQYSVK